MLRNIGKQSREEEEGYGGKDFQKRKLYFDNVRDGRRIKSYPD